jgi:hypothetical protein
MINTGYWKDLVGELIICTIMPLPFIWDITYEEVN